MPPWSGTSIRPKTPTTRTSGMPSAMRPRARPNHALTTSATPTSVSASANMTPRSTSTTFQVTRSQAPPASTSSRHQVTGPRYERRPARAGAVAVTGVVSGWVTSLLMGAGGRAIGPAAGAGGVDGGGGGGDGGAGGSDGGGDGGGARNDGGGGGVRTGDLDSCAASRVRSHSTAAPRAMSTTGQNAPPRS